MLAGILGLSRFIEPPLQAQGSITPSPYQVLLDSAGNPVVSGKICTYLAGGTTPTPTYTDSTLVPQNQNPIITDGSGRWRAFLSPGTSYRFDIYSNDGTANTCNGTLLRTQDNITAVPGSSANVDVTGTAGEAITAGQVVYLSAGAGGKNAGQWYKGDAANSYSSINATVGIAPAAITSGSTGTIRLAGYVTGLTGLVVGTDYYISSSSAGSLVATAPNQARFIGRADTTTSIVVAANPSYPTGDDVVCGRLTLTSTVPVTTADVTSATTVYYTPYGCNVISLYDGTALWNKRLFSEISLSVPAAANTNYDYFIYDSNGSPTIEVGSAWTSNTAIYASGTYQTSRPLQDGRWVKSTNGTAIDATRRYVGTIRTEANATGYTDDSARQRFVFNAYNRHPRSLVRLETVTSWTYSTATWRQANGNPYNQVEVVRGLNEDPVDLGVYATAFNTGGVWAGVTIGVDTTTVPAAYPVVINAIAALADTLVGHYVGAPGLGYHDFRWTEISQASGTTHWLAGADTSALGAGPAPQSGLIGVTKQ